MSVQSSYEESYPFLHFPLAVLHGFGSDPPQLSAVPAVIGTEEEGLADRGEIQRGWRCARRAGCP